MTRVVFTRTADGLISALDIRGHAGYGAAGEDIICAAITSAIQLTHILLEDILELDFDTRVEQESTYIHLFFPADVREAAQDAMEALRLHYREMQESYSKFLTVLEVYSDAEN